MTVPRLAVIAIVCFLFVDLKFGSGRGVDALWDQATRLGHWLNTEFDALSNMIARFR
jgi:hypothetical protein